MRKEKDPTVSRSRLSVYTFALEKRERGKMRATAEGREKYKQYIYRNIFLFNSIQDIFLLQISIFTAV